MRTIVELLHLAAGLLVTTVMVIAASWAYPMGRGVFWWCGAAAMATAVLTSLGPLRRARASDRKVS